MYCPVCGDEFREGFTRCPEHDVELVEEPVDIEAEEREFPHLPALDERFGIRVAFGVLLASAIVYALTTLIYNLASVWALWLRTDPTDPFGWQHIRAAAFSLGLGSFGVLAGAVLLRTYQRISRGYPAPRAKAAFDEPESKWVARLTGAGFMRLLLALVGVFALVWFVTGVVTQNEVVRYQLSFPIQSDLPTPSRGLISMVALHDVTFDGGIAAFALMAAALMVRTHQMLTSGSPNSDPVADEEDARA